MRPDYKRHDPKGWCGDPKRGAALGRHSYMDEPADYAGELFVEPVVLDDGGYDPQGTYFGDGSPIFWIANADLTVDYVIRATNRGEAVAVTRERWRKATIAGVTREGYLDAMVASYLAEIVAWCEDEKPDLTVDDIAESTVAEAREACGQFFDANRADLTADDALEPDRAGYLFWHNRNGSGVGFWDGRWPEPAATRLDAAAKACGNVGAYVGDDGKIYVS